MCKLVLTCVLRKIKCEKRTRKSEQLTLILSVKKSVPYFYLKSRISYWVFQYVVSYFGRQKNESINQIEYENEFWNVEFDSFILLSSKIIKQKSKHQLIQFIFVFCLASRLSSRKNLQQLIIIEKLPICVKVKYNSVRVHYFVILFIFHQRDSNPHRWNTAAPIFAKHIDETFNPLAKSGI